MKAKTIYDSMRLIAAAATVIEHATALYPHIRKIDVTGIATDLRNRLGVLAFARDIGRRVSALVSPAPAPAPVRKARRRRDGVTPQGRPNGHYSAQHA